MSRVNWRDEQPAYKQIGTRKVMNTDFSVDNKVMRIGPHQWQVLFLLCNGAWDRMQVYNSRRAAYEAAGILS